MNFIGQVDAAGVGVLSRKHEHAGERVLLRGSARESLFLLELLDAIGVAQRVEGVLAALAAGRDVRNHCGHAVSDERVFKHLSELGAAERRVLLVLVEGSNAFFKC